MIRIVGDVCFSDGYFDLGFGIGSMLKDNYDPFQNLMFDSDTVWLGNLECVISDNSDSTNLKTKYFRIPFRYLSSIQHLNIYGVANNHVMQHGSEAYSDTLANINKLGSKYVGNLKNKTLTFDHNNHKFGVTVFSLRGEASSEKPLYWFRPEYDEIEAELDQNQKCDCKIAYIHWGVEFMDYPYFEQRKFAHWLINIGFDLVVGTHSHVLQGYEVYKKKYIFYSLGNFLFNMPTEATRYSAIVNIDIEQGKILVSYDYVIVDKHNKPKIIEKKNVPEKYLFETLNSKISNEYDIEDYLEEMIHQLSTYRHKNHYWIFKTFYKHNSKELFFILSDYLTRRFKMGGL